VLVVLMMLLLSDRQQCAGGRSFLLIHRFENGVEAPEPLLRPLPVRFDPLGHQVENLGFQVAGAPLGVPAVADQPGVFQHSQVLRDGLHGDAIRLRQLTHCGVTNGESRDHVASSRVGQRRKDPRQLIF
jgi:hypothetical protein